MWSNGSLLPTRSRYHNFTMTWNNENLPAATGELHQAVHDVDAYGYCLIEQALPDATIAEVRTRIDEQAQAEREQGFHRLSQVQDPGGINQWVNLLINKGEVFQNLLLHPTVSGVVDHLLGEEHVLSDFAAHVVRPGNTALPLHIDQWWMPQPRLPGEDYVRVGATDRSAITAGKPERSTQPINPPCVVNAFWMISEFTAENGATRIVPGSHLSGQQPDQQVPHSVDTVALTGNAGTVAIWDGRTWHAAGQNNTNGARYGVTSYYGGPQFRSLTNYTLGTLPEILQNVSPELRKLLGFKIWNEYGRTGESEDGFALPASEQLPEMKP